MRLKRLEIYGFKSFADRTVIEFGEGITGVVGPNGSGKSNISDAVRWVLGEQSAKSLRGGRMEDVIFNGTQRRKRLGYCEVSLVIDNEDHELQTDYSEVMITRRTYRSGEGEYYLNKTACRLKDLLDLFRDTGIGKDGYSIVGQGRIDEILSQKSDDRRGVFEEATGITKYRSRKEESEKRLSNMRENLVRIDDILGELSSQLEPLEKASQLARRYLSLRDELRILECTVFVTRSDRDGLRISELRTLIEELQAQIAKQEAEAAAFSAEREDINQSLAELEAALNQAHSALLELTRESEARAGSLKVSRTQLANLESDAVKTREAIEEGKAEHSRIQLELTDYGVKKATQSRIIASLEEERQMASGKADAMLADLSATEEELEARQEAYVNAINRLGDVRSSEARLETMRSQLEAQQKDAEQKKERLTLDAEGLLEQIQDTKAEEMRLTDEETDQKSALLSIEETVRQTSQEIDHLYHTLDDLTGEQKGIESRLHILREMARDYAGYQHAVKAILQHTRSDRRVHGTVASLIRVPKELEKAIESALGNALQNVVTQDEYTARDLIDYLRKNNQGRATFFPLSTIQGRGLRADERRFLSMPGCLGVASEQISFDECYRGIVENLLGRTVLATNLDAGIAIMRQARQGFRLVTLDGDVMNPGGAMTGGSANSRMTSLLSRDREIEEHQAAASTVAHKIEATRLAIQQKKQDKSQANAQIDGLRSHLQRTQVDLSVVQERLDALNRRNAELQTEQDHLSTLTEQIAQNRTAIERQLQSAHSTQEGEEKSHEEMQRLTQALGDAVIEKRRILESQRDAVHQMELSLSQHRKDAETLELQEQRLLRDALHLGSELTHLEEYAQKLVLDHQRLTERIALEVTEQAQAQDRLAEAASELEAQEKRRTSQTHKIQSLTEHIDAIRTSISDAADRVHKSEILLNRLQGELDQITQRVWEEYELTYAGAKAYLKEDYLPSRDDARIGSIRAQMRGMGPINLSATEEYQSCKQRFDDLTAQRDDLLGAQEDLMGIIASLHREMETRFLQGFTQLQEYLSEAFTKLFGGGKAELRLTDEKDVLGSGIEIVAQPPGKKLQLLSLLSGGERALTAIAILFAMLRLKPTPFCFLDEIEAALDDGNIATFASYLQDFSKDTQFVIVTHRKGTMAFCDGLYGVSMEEQGVSKMLSVELKDLEDEIA